MAMSYEYGQLLVQRGLYAAVILALLGGVKEHELAGDIGLSAEECKVIFKVRDQARRFANAQIPLTEYDTSQLT